MKNIQWSNVLLFLFHGGLMLAAAYAAAHADKYGWAVPPLMTMASLSNAPKWSSDDTPAPAPSPAIPSGPAAPIPAGITGSKAAVSEAEPRPGALHMLS